MLIELYFTYTKYDTISTISSIREHKIWIGIFGPAMMDLPFKSFIAFILAYHFVVIFLTLI